jgi:HTH-type transcriptional repressor of NAD biosynthesis genes
MKSDMVKKVCFYGPESTGKTTMAIAMAKHYRTEFVPEVAREIITTNAFTAEDIIKIGFEQTKRIQEKTKSANRILFCDTDLITTQIYSQQYLNEIPPVLFELEKKVKFDLYFFFEIDVPWVADGLRDLGHQRQQMRQIFEAELIKRNLSFIRVFGDWNGRFAIIQSQIDKMLDG